MVTCGFAHLLPAFEQTPSHRCLKGQGRLVSWAFCPCGSLRGLTWTFGVVKAKAQSCGPAVCGVGGGPPRCKVF